MNKKAWVLLITVTLISTNIKAESCEKKWAKYYAGKSWFEPWCDTESYKRRVSEDSYYENEYVPTEDEIKQAQAQANAQRYKQASDALRKAAEQGDAVAQNNLGMRYVNGQGEVQDYKQAVAWFRKAAEQGDAVAQYNLGSMYDKGQGVVQDYQQAVAWYRKAAEQGDAGAQYNLGICFADGVGVAQDYMQAYAWLSAAAANGGDVDTVNARDMVAGWLTPATLRKGQALATRYFVQYQPKP
ncbi:tetratricopeptide repeat protein [Aeromonas rivipollensis]|uniref:Sel1 repeat family protein n=1 Tax=Aeromonas rivipollensis TaxID=948519 RepID=A0AAW9Y7J9_9GAMM|nr:tetratricopeptide repeat protein [Aeromonas rivipollensis]NEX73774.1 sel1 repeat family protein [Aeromonas rivipollensis]